MVKSLLNDEINYNENTELEKQDINYESPLYEMELLDITINIAIGNIKNTSDLQISYFPVYLIYNDNVISKIGIYELYTNELVNIIDEDNDIDITKLDNMLPFNILNRNYLQKYTVDNVQDDDVKVEEEKEIDEIEEKVIEEIKKDVHSKIVKKELWINTFLKDKNYNIIDNEGGGDCLFAVIRDGLEKVGVNISVSELRIKLSEEVTQEILDNYKNIYIALNRSLKETELNLKMNLREYNKLKNKSKLNVDYEERKELNKKAKLFVEENKLLKLEKKNTINMLNEFKFMDNIDTIDDFKNIIKTCYFWADTWAISTLERIMNIKLILFSEEMYKNKDIDNVLQCGQLNDSVLENKGIFKPDYYIMTDYFGEHYKLITYKSKGALTFQEIPENIKLLIVNKCLERQSGTFYIIPEFREYMESLNQQIPLIQEEEIVHDNLYDDSTIFRYYIRSNDNMKPGKGTGEKININDINLYNKLQLTKSWRKKLSNLWESEFDLDGHKWKSVENYYQASKFKNNNPEFYLSFSLDMNPKGKLSNDPHLAKAAGSERPIYKGKRVRDKNIKIDEDFYPSGRNLVEKKRALFAKFNQNEELKNMLLNTLNAKLVNYIPKKEPKTSIKLMEVRKELR